MSLNQELFRMIEILADRIEENLNFRVASILYKENGDIDLSIHGGGTFLVASKIDPNLTYENLEVVLTSEAYQHIKPGNFNYVDVRFEKKVFVNEELKIATSTREIATSTSVLV